MLRAIGQARAGATFRRADASEGVHAGGPVVVAVGGAGEGVDAGALAANRVGAGVDEGTFGPAGGARMARGWSTMDQ